jgi:hypothetical protein
MSEIRVTPTEDGFELRLSGGDEATFRQLVGGLKRHVPAFARRYDGNSRCWRVSAEAATDLEAWLSAAGRHPDVDVIWEPPFDI